MPYSSPPPATVSTPPTSRPKRPRYLAVALVGALVFGAGCWGDGCARLTFYRGDREHLAALNDSVHGEDARARVEALYQRYIDVAEDGRGRAIPLAAATFVLGAALLALSARAFSGRSNTRSALVQVVAVQAIVVAAGYFGTKSSREAEHDWQVEQLLAQEREALPDEQQYQQAAAVIQAVRRYGAPTWLALRTIASGLIVLALTRPRSRQFFEPASESLSEP